MLDQAIQTLKKQGVRQILLQVLNIAAILTSTFMIWNGLAVVTNVESPFVVVLSESMSPGFERGDVIFLRKTASDLYNLASGDIVVYKIPEKPIPIVHRILEVHTDFNLELSVNGGRQASRHRLLTKGDYNSVDDLALYEGLEWLEDEHIIGKVSGYVPYVGYVSILLNESPKFKFAVLGVIGLFNIFQRE
ncbi:hypothetical protein CPB83DRAFT_909469 [Crepidotus variabilis]|uniref:Signal peptidase complex catalytic subunit SEC11 n=1 Tax=Crepidotus variabilis TaxID=179855 RepID=A0A9P6EA19_9AGAR|nr:hypothetical protein CPB83DRAFT_909469 [Crepidotus variabilis]